VVDATDAMEIERLTLSFLEGRERTIAWSRTVGPTTCSPRR
jgi:hypothetical protein